jgi:hypothetical protein
MIFINKKTNRHPERRRPWGLMIFTIVGALFLGLWIHGHLVYITGAFMALVMANGTGRASGTAHLLFIFGFLFEQILTCVSGGYGGFFSKQD